MKQKIKRWLLAAGICGCALLAGALPVSAEPAPANITTQMTMKEIRENPGIVGSGIATYDKSDGDIRLVRRLNENKTLLEYAGTPQAEDCAAALNLAIENYNRGVQVTWQLYSPEEIAEDPSLGAAQLYYFPAEQPNAKYVLTIGGNGDIKTGVMGEAMSIVPELHEKGYTVFVLRHRIFMDAGDDAPMQDAKAALKLINDHAEQFGVQREDYALLGFSSGGQILSLLASENEQYGCRSIGVQPPAALLLAYPVNDFYELKPVYAAVMDTGNLGRRFYWLNISDVVTAGFPPTYYWCSRGDVILSLVNWEAQCPVLEEALTRAGVPHKGAYYDGVPHAVGTAHGTAAEGWLEKAIAFWESYMKNKT